jgi:hypothetical protein
MLFLLHHRSKCGENFCHYTFDVPGYFAIAKAQDGKALPVQVRIARCIFRPSFFRIVLNSVNFYDDALSKAGKINDEVINQSLPTEMISLVAQLPKLFPQLFFCNSFFLSQVTSDLVGHPAASSASTLFRSPHP